jgi:hypothetical protein
VIIDRATLRSAFSRMPPRPNPIFTRLEKAFFLSARHARERARNVARAFIREMELKKDLKEKICELQTAFLSKGARMFLRRLMEKVAIRKHEASAKMIILKSRRRRFFVSMKRSIENKEKLCHFLSERERYLKVCILQHLSKRVQDRMKDQHLAQSVKLLVARRWFLAMQRTACLIGKSLEWEGRRACVTMRAWRSRVQQKRAKAARQASDSEKAFEFLRSCLLRVSLARWHFGARAKAADRLMARRGLREWVRAHKGRSYRNFLTFELSVGSLISCI